MSRRTVGLAWAYEDETGVLHACKIDSRGENNGVWRTQCTPGIVIGHFDVAADTMINVNKAEITCIGCAAEVARFYLLLGWYE